MTESSSENLVDTIGVAAQRQFNTNISNDNPEPLNHPSSSANVEFDLGDPTPPITGCSAAEKQSYLNAVETYANDMLKSLENTKLTSESLWLEFTSTFRKETIFAMSATSVLNWIHFLRRNGVYVISKRGYARPKALNDCLQAEGFRPATGNTDESDVTSKKENGNIAETDSPNEAALDQSSKKSRTRPDLPEKKNTAPPEGLERDKKRMESDSFRTSSSFESRKKRGIDSLMKAYVSHLKFSGSFIEDFDGSLQEFETIAKVCELTDEEMAQGFPIMLKGAAFSHYSRNFAKKNMTYREPADAFRGWYTSEEQRQRLLDEWRTPSLLKKLQESPDKSELEVFRDLSDRMTRIQFQLHNDYHKDRLLRDTLLAAADVEHVKRPLKDKVPENAQEAMQRIARLLSSEKGSAGANFIGENCDQANYGLGMRFGGKALKHLKGSHRKKPSKSRSLAAVKGCWVCGKYHKARDYHSTQDILDALNRLKKEQPNVLFTLDDVEQACQIFVASSPDESSYDSDSTSDDAVNLALTRNDECHKEVEVYLANASFVHRRTFSRSFQTDLDRSMKMMHAALHVGEESRFEGIILDTGANRKSVMSLSQYKSYCREFKVPLKIDRTNNRRLTGIGGTASAIGTATIPIPFSELGIVIDVEFRILNGDCPNLLCLRDMKNNGLDISLQENTLSFKHKTQALVYENDFLKHKWKAEDMDFVLYTEKELRRLHRVFGHPSVTALQNLLRRANPEDISKECEVCERYASRPRRFKLTVGTDDSRFNYIVAVDIMYINGKPVLHIVDEATHFAAATFMKSVSAEENWKCLLKCWIRTYLGPPDHLRIDQGSNFVATHFSTSAEAEGIHVLEAPIECPSTMTHVERYHAPLRVAYNKIRDTLPRKTETDSDCLQLAVKSVNDTIGPEGLCPTLLVFMSLPRPPRKTPAATQLERARAMDAAMKAVEKEHAKRRIAFALRHPGGPKQKEEESDLEKLPSGAPVLVFREKSKKWEGPFPFVHADSSTVVVQLSSGRKIFRSNVVKPAPHISTEATWNRKDDQNSENLMVNYSSETSCPEKFSVSDECLSVLFGVGEQKMMNPNEKYTFVESRRTELQGLQERGTFKIVPRSSVPKGTRVYGTRLVDIVKVMNGKEVQKSRLVAQNFRDKGATAISTRSPTVSRMGQRLLVATASSYPDHSSYVRDISQAYVQSSTSLEREVYLRPPEEMGLGPDYVLLALKPLYGIPESGMHWFVTYQSHHIDELEMKQCRSDPCVLYRRRKSEASDGITALQVDDSYGHGNEQFLEDEERASKRFQCKPRKILKPGDSAFFNGTRISILEDGTHLLDQSIKLEKLSVPNNDNDLVTTRALVQYIGSCTRPDLCAPSQLLSSAVTEPTTKTFKDMEKIIKWCQETNNIGLKFVPLDVEDCSLMLFTDSSFANARKGKSQLGFVVALVDKTGKGNIIHYGSTSCKRVARSVMAAELLGLVNGFDQAFVVRDMLQEVTGNSIEIDAFVDSQTLFNLVAKHSNPLEKRLMIDVYALRQSHKNGELRNILWIPTSQNVADGLTKKLITKSHPLWKLMTENKVPVTPLGWVEKKATEKENP